jgi:hypothetical protein
LGCGSCVPGFNGPGQLGNRTSRDRLSHFLSRPRRFGKSLFIV